MDVGHLLYEACTKLGYCLPADEQSRFVEAPPPDIDSFTDAVLKSEGLDPTIVDKRQRLELRNLVARHFEEKP